MGMIATRKGSDPSPPAPPGVDRGVLRGLVRDCMVAFGLLLALNTIAGPTGFWSADEAVAHRQVDLLAEGRWAEPHATPDLDPDGRWHAMSPLSLGDGVAGPYVKHPLFPLLVRLGDALFGPLGRFALPALSAVVAAALIALGADRRTGGSARTAFWFSLLGTPLLFHGAMLWAHAPAMAAAAGWYLLLQRALEPGTADRIQGRGQRWFSWWALQAALVATMVLLRSEAAIFTVVTGAALLLFAVVGALPGTEDDSGRVDDERRLAALGASTIAVSIGAFVVDGLLRAAILGPGGDVALAVPPEPLLDLQVRLGLVWRWLVGATPQSGLGLARIIGAILLAAAAISARPSSRLTLTPWLGLAGGLLYLPALLAESTVSVAPAAPAVLVGLLMVERCDSFSRFVTVVASLFFGAVVATSYANGGGGDWGGRYLALIIAPAAMIGLAALHRIAAERSFRPIIAGGAVATVALAFGMSIDVISARRDTSALSAALVAEVESRQDDLDLIVATDSRIGRLLGGQQLPVPMLQVPTDQLDILAARLPAGSDVVIIDLFDTVEVSETWIMRERTPHLIVVRPAD